MGVSVEVMTESVCGGYGSVLAGCPSITGTASDARLCDPNTAFHYCIWDHRIQQPYNQKVHGYYSNVKLSK
ncbi:hypothetical protein DY000_02049838 [Brassica cretica]|uniref:Uncharacterized protein n=1 Tax=Brassica cretica TaxID=69181 RepID=A0ABQ7EP76_BRACR|nr:hypothetical protein DY000_02049838 [Brassica cretica]